MKIDKPHCSKLDRIFACPGSILPADGPREAGGPEAVAGTAKHEALACITQDQEPPVDDIASRHGVDRDEIEMAVRLGRKAWKDLAPYFPDPVAECPIESSVCIGTSDLVQVMTDASGVTAIRNLDWKTGWGTDEHPRQLQGYALGLVEQHGWPANDVISVFEVWTSHQQTRTTNLGRGDLDAFRGELAAIIKTAEESPDKLGYRAGAHCRFCPHRATCGPRGDWMRSAVTAIAEVDPKQAITVEDIGAAYARFQEVERACYQFKKIVEAALEDGPIPLPDGRQVAYVESEREKIGAAAALDALASWVGPEDHAALLGDISKKALDNWAKANSAKGKKAALMREIMGELRNSDAIRAVPYRQRKTVDR